MPENWKTFTVEELIKNKILEKPLDGNHGGSHPKGKDFISSGIPFVMASDIIRGQVNLKSCSFISKIQGDKLRKGFAIEGDVLLTHKASIGRTAIVPKIETEYIMLTPQVTYYRVLDKKQLNNHYLKFYFNSPEFQNELNMRAGSGSTRAYIGITDQQKLSIIVPPLQEQKSIASILSALDDKIELNLQMNKTLEEMAMALYKHWFVDFGPFQDGEFVDSELGEIPKGWEVRSIYSIADFVNGAAFKPRDLLESNNKGLPVIKIAEIKQGITSQTKYSEKELDNKYFISNGDILFPWSGNPHTSLGIHIWDKGNALLNQHIFVVRTEDTGQKCFVFNLLKYQLPTFINLATHKQTTGLGHITVANLKELQIPYPNKEALEKYNEEGLPIFDLMYNNQLENISLTQLRDILLPKLISGEVRVKDVEKTLSEVL
ncbi:hypothetical protein C7S20_09175 [Christiangramia fulva]|uniref:Type I restriction modification DNA specificity domain-containing protein n=1 Tax=Christiangramia fulva TaxID=2126553 RepID=A0A2R3Z570_9FLAO|nr:restriction endonuclease subunit S [Christiangramia fulva]AVR45427.1 hypothetical protein C7S20_09175 [Christiangramia fulva]